MKAVLEGLLFVVGEDGLSVEQIADILEIDIGTAKDVISSLKSDYEDKNRGLRIDFLGNKIKLTTKKEHRDYYRKLVEDDESGSTLSQAALEVLAIIAYNEPITRISLDEIRGVSNSHIIRKLVSKGFIKESGRSDLPGRPILYETTSEFLDYFGMNSIDDLPNMEEFIEAASDDDKSDDVDLYHSKYRDDVEDGKSIDVTEND